MSKCLIKRMLSGVLAGLLVITTPLTALADTPGGGQSANFPVIKPGGSGYTPSAGIFRDYGFRVTVTTNSPITEAGVTKIVKNSNQARKGEYLSWHF